jgi:hypothetical protein
MTSLTLEQIEEMGKLEKEAASGPWKAIHEQGWCNNHVVHLLQGGNIENSSDQYDLYESATFETCELIAHSRNALPALLHMARGFLEAREAIGSYDYDFPDASMFCKWMEKYGNA